MQQGTAPRAAGMPTSPGRAAVTFLVCAIFFTLATLTVGLAAHGLASALPGAGASTVAPLVSLVVLFAGFLVIARVRVPELRPLSAVGLVRRPSAGREFALGTAIGWATGIALVLPGLVLLRMRSSLAFDGFHLGSATASVLVLFFFVLSRQLVLCGLPYRSLSQATSPLFASVAFAGLAGLLTFYTASADAPEVLLAGMAQLVFGFAAARTRAIWLGTALQFAWGVTVTVLFGLPSFLWPPATGLVRSSMFGPRWLTGNIFGPEAALWAGLVVLAALAAVWRLTREYAWHYTFDPIVASGYAMDVPPPAEHTRMEQAGAPTAPLVQIGGAATPRTPQEVSERGVSEGL